MLVATVIMSVAVVGMLAGLSGATRNAAKLREYDRVTQLARLQMNDLVAAPNLRPGSGRGGVFDPAIAGGLEAGWQARVTSLGPAPQQTPLQPGQMTVDQISLEVWWMSGSTRRTVSLETARLRLAGAE